MKKTKLVCHPDLLDGNVSSLEVEVEQLDLERLRFIYRLTGNISRIKIPGQQKPAQTDGLWQHTCFEVFISVKDELGYIEFNFSPSTQWAAYQFSDYRERIELAEQTMPVISTQTTENQLLLNAEIKLPTHLINQDLQLGLTVVIENNHEQLTYWALQHPAAKPDFHLREGFNLLLPTTNRTN